MKKSISVSIAKFIAGLILINYITFYTIKQYSYATIENVTQFQRLQNSNFIQYYTNVVISGNWGFDQNGELISAYLHNYVIFSSISYIVILILSFLLSLCCYYLINQKNPRLINKFRGNWLLYLLIFVIPFILVFVIQNPRVWIYDGVEVKNVYLSIPFFTFLIMIILLSTSKLLSEISMIPNYSKSINEDLTYPIDNPDIIENTNSSISESQSIFVAPIIALKTSSILIFDIYALGELFLNFPGLFHFLIMARLGLNIILAIPVIFFISIIIFIPHLVLDIIVILLRANKDAKTTTRFHPTIKTSTDYSKFTYYGFIGLSLLLVIYGTFIGFSTIPGILFIYDPDFVNTSLSNLGVLSDGHLLGTDYLGRDIFSRLFFSISSFFLPILITSLIRPTLAILIQKLPEFGNISISKALTDVFHMIPRVPTMILLTLMTGFVSTELFQGPFFIILANLLFWSWPSIYLTRLREATHVNLTFMENFKKLLPLTTASIIIELFIINYLGLLQQASLLGIYLSWGNEISNIFQNYASRYPIKIALTYIFVLTPIAGIMRYAQNVLTNN